MTVVEAIKCVLSQSEEGLTAQEIYQLIDKRGLFQFAAKDPVHIVRTALRRHCQGLNFLTSCPDKHFQIVQGRRGKTTYTLLNLDESPSKQLERKTGRKKLPEAIIYSAYADRWEKDKVRYDAALFGK